ncbi:macrolide family glycosyltransferase [Clostridium estertheticum]|uniref:macrolide family glycosyltransferase n=1 Tax=Clostridium estertheticum TaxID=238834 RepID=UPI001C7DA51E|nr:macrolide family glycosyltransferase [Clostridium estertheticum]MBX4266690.1 glycosyl transferase [Clostridium estertheticum]MBX4271496.1 glycosyl transferase [Clostridium estertheticum]WLC81048.1 glycosyl transferase [Clostridium estertheticum]WLC88189.1 glycosyl transferase [Clostridium estertheticum]
MKRVLFINVFGDGHINPTIGLVKELINRGEKVTYIAGEEFREKIEKAGATFIGHKSMGFPKNFGPPNGEAPHKMPGNVEPPFKMIDTLKEMIEEIIEATLNSSEKFDYIIYDSMFFLGNEVGRILKVPAISSVTTFAMNEDTNVLGGETKEMASKIQGFSNSPLYKEFAAHLQEKYGIELPDLSTVFNGSGMINIVYTSKYFQIHGESFDERYKFIGPSIADRNEDIDFSLENNDKKKLIYISLGTIFNNSIDFYESCFKAFGNMDAKIIMSVGKNTEISDFKSIPSNFIVRNYVPQLKVLKQTDVFITHAGMNSTSEGLYYDVPLVLIPQTIDQPAVANRVAQLGAGIVIDKDKITPEILKQSVVKILRDDNYKMNSEKIGKSLREAGGYKKGVDEILNLKYER